MFRRGKERVIRGGKIETWIGEATSFDGHLQVDGNLRIEGHCEGVIETLGNVIVAETAVVDAHIHAHSIQVWGAVEGKIVATERLEILHTAQVFADVEVNSLFIDDDAVFRGGCVIREKGEPVEPFPAASPASEGEETIISSPAETWPSLSEPEAETDEETE